ncbi:MAG: hypothetical protein AAGI37_18140 [Planctomycetota bacterium]
MIQKGIDRGVIVFAAEIGRAIRDNSGESRAAEQLSEFFEMLNRGRGRKGGALNEHDYDDPEKQPIAGDYPLYDQPTYDPDDLERWQEQQHAGVSMAAPTDLHQTMIRRRFTMAERYAVLLALHAAWMPNDDPLIAWLQDEVAMYDEHTEKYESEYGVHTSWLALVERAKLIPIFDIPQLEIHLEAIIVDMKEYARVETKKTKTRPLWEQARAWMLKEFEADRLPKSINQTASNRNNKFKTTTLQKAVKESEILQYYFGTGKFEGKRARQASHGRPSKVLDHLVHEANSRMSNSDADMTLPVAFEEGLDTSLATINELLQSADPDLRRYINGLSDHERLLLNSQLANAKPEERVELIKTLSVNPEAGQCGDVEYKEGLTETYR